MRGSGGDIIDWPAPPHGPMPTPDAWGIEVPLATAPSISSASHAGTACPTRAASRGDMRTGESQLLRCRLTASQLELIIMAAAAAMRGDGGGGVRRSPKLDEGERGAGDDVAARAPSCGLVAAMSGSNRVLLFTCRFGRSRTRLPLGMNGAATGSRTRFFLFGASAAGGRRGGRA